MPVIKQAIKKVRQDKRKAAFNLLRRTAYKRAVKDFLKHPTEAGLKGVFSAVDRAAKTNVIHRNKAARLKSRLSKKLKPASKTSSTSSVKPAPKAAKKKSK